MSNESDRLEQEDAENNRLWNAAMRQAGGDATVALMLVQRQAFVDLTVTHDIHADGMIRPRKARANDNTRSR